MHVYRSTPQSSAQRRELEEKERVRNEVELDEEVGEGERGRLSVRKGGRY